jgi:pre-mRNA-splicing factor ISY1
MRKGRAPEEGDKGPGRAELSKFVDAGYYGYNLDEEDGTLLAYEEQREREAYNSLIEEAGDERGEPPFEPLPGDVGDGIGWRLPSVEEVEEELIDRRRRRLLDKLG